LKRAKKQKQNSEEVLRKAKIAKSEAMVVGFFVILALILPIKGYFSLAQDNAQATAVNIDSSTTGGDQAGATGTNADAANLVDPNAALPFPDFNKEELLRQSKTSQFFDRIKTEINLSENSLMDINNQVGDANSKIQDTQEKISTLSDQLAGLDTQIKNSEDMINNVSAQIDRKQSEIDTLQYQIEQKKTEISFQKQTVLEYLKVIFKDQSGFNSMSENGSELNTLKLLLSDDTASENLRSLRYSEVLENQGKEIFEKLNTMVDEQETNQKILEVKKRTLQLLYIKLQEEKDGLGIQRQAKATLLEQTKGDQKIYEAMLAKSNAEEQDMLMEIDTLHKNMLFVQEKMKALGSNFNPDDYTKLLNAGSNKNLVEYLAGASGNNADFQPKWPINPGRGISAFYHEASYYSVFHMQHNAVDIRTPQNTPIHAPADGVVYRAQDNGYGYSYVMIAHAGGFMTLYGHVTKILVTEGQEVKAGDIIGLSGATPGTKGAGLYTTGPHLHFEILKDGVHVDPLDYMNLAYLQLDSLPEKYVAKALGDREKVRRIPTQAKVRNPNSVKNTDGNPADMFVDNNATLAGSVN
jgi:murein DD-endopeptidase MepM/ murein hydrolase activator NlpD